MANRKISNELTDTFINALKPLQKPLRDENGEYIKDDKKKKILTESTDKDYAVPDGKGLQLLIKTNGTKLWECRYTVDGKPKKTTLGNYPDVGIADARKKRDEYWQKAKQGINPIEAKREAKQAQETENKGQFHLVAKEWIDSLNKITPVTKKEKLRLLDKDILPYLSLYDKDHNLTSSRHLSTIKHTELLKIIQDKEKSAKDNAKKIYYILKNLFDFAILHDYCEINPMSKIPIEILQKNEAEHHAKITDEAKLKELLLTIDNYHGEPITRLMLKFLSLSALRIGNIAGTKNNNQTDALRWDYVDFDKKIITIPRKYMKVKDKNIPDFKLPLSSQALEVLQETKRLTGWGEWVFHGLKDIKRPINPETGAKALKRMGFNDAENDNKQRQHSFRGTFRSLVATHQDKHGIGFDICEYALDHQIPNKSTRAYLHKANYVEQMRPLMQWWADYLDTLKSKEP